MCTRIHLKTHTHTQADSYTPHIPDHTLNLINHIKLYINRPNTKKAEDRKKKEQESAEAISGLKMSPEQ